MKEIVKSNAETTKVEPDKIAEKKPNEQSGFYFSSAIKITDPNSGEILVQMRAD
jgi:hypothetical protein